MLPTSLEIAVDLVTGLKPVDDLRLLDDDLLTRYLSGIGDDGDAIVEPPEILTGT